MVLCVRSVGASAAKKGGGEGVLMDEAKAQARAHTVGERSTCSQFADCLLNIIDRSDALYRVFHANKSGATFAELTLF